MLLLWWTFFIKNFIQFFHLSFSRMIWVWVFRSHSHHGSRYLHSFFLAMWSWILGPLLSFMSDPIQIWKLTHMLIQVTLTYFNSLYKLNLSLEDMLYSGHFLIVDNQITHFLRILYFQLRLDILNVFYFLSLGIFLIYSFFEIQKRTKNLKK